MFGSWGSFRWGALLFFGGGGVGGCVGVMVSCLVVCSMCCYCCTPALGGLGGLGGFVSEEGGLLCVGGGALVDTHVGGCR